MRLNKNQLKDLLDRATNNGFTKGALEERKKIAIENEQKKIEAITKLLTAAGQFQEAITRLMLSDKDQL